MSLEVKFIDEILGVADLRSPQLSILEPNPDLANILLFQPLGKIRVGSGPTHIGNEPDVETNFKYFKFFELALDRQVHLASTPEYSCPLSVTCELIEKDIFPSSGKLWAIGSESLTKDGLIDFKNFCEEKGVLLFFDDSVLKDPQDWVDPMIYAFRTKNSEGIDCKVAVIQFKTINMGVWTNPIERSGLITGKEVYILRSNESSIYLVTLICSDSLNFDKIIRGIESKHPNCRTHPYLFLHLQLNPKPFNYDFSRYRNSLFDKNFNFELICLNWARKSGEFKNGKLKPWIGFSGSCHTLKSTEIDDSEEIFHKNFNQGLYFTNRSRNRYSYYLHSDEWVFHLRTPKVRLEGSTPTRRRSGPTLHETLIWTGKKWNPMSESFADYQFFSDYESFSDLIGEDISPLDVERLLEISTGSLKSSNPEDPWWVVKNLKFLSQSESETIHSMIFSQDNSEEATEHRTIKAEAFNELQEVLIRDPNAFPEHFEKFKRNIGKIRFPAEGVPRDRYSVNLCTNDGKEWITVVNLGIRQKSDAARVHKTMERTLHGQNGKRLLVWFTFASAKYWFYDETPVKITDNIPRRPTQEIESITR